MILPKSPGGAKNPISAGFNFLKEKSKEITNTLNTKTNELGLKNQEKHLHNMFLGYMRDFFKDNLTFSETEKNEIIGSDFYRNLTDEEKTTLDNLMNECIKKNETRQRNRAQQNLNLHQQQAEAQEQYIQRVERQNKYHEFMREIITNIEAQINEAEKLFHQNKHNEAISAALQAKDSLYYNKKILGLLALQVKIILNKIPFIKGSTKPRGHEYDRIMILFERKIDNILDASEKTLLEENKHHKKSLIQPSRNNPNYQAASHTIARGQREEVYNGNTLRGFMKAGVPYQLTIAQQRIKLCNQNNQIIECHIVKQSHGAEKLFTIIDTEGKTLTDKFFHDYRLVKKGNNTHIMVQYENHGKLEELAF